MPAVLSKRKSRRNEGGFSLIELLIVIAIILIILAIALPKLNQARMNAQETAAISQIETLHKAETMYYSQFGRYATSLAELGPPSGGGNMSPTSADLIPATLSAGENTGYVFTVQGTPTGYAVTAVPKAFALGDPRIMDSTGALLLLGAGLTLMRLARRKSLGL